MFIRLLKLEDLYEKKIRGVVIIGLYNILIIIVYIGWVCLEFFNKVFMKGGKVIFWKVRYIWRCFFFFLYMIILYV